MRRITVLLLLAAMIVLPSVAYAHVQTINFRCIFQYCHDRFYALAGVTMYNPETADWTIEGGVGILDADEFTLLSLIFANAAAPNHDDVHNAFLQNSARARVVIGSTIIGLTTSSATSGPTARQLIPGSSPAAYYAADGLMGAYLTLGEWNTYDTTMAGFKGSPFGTAVLWTTETGQNDDKKVEYDMDHAGLVSMCGDEDSDGAKNCNEFWSDGDYAGAIVNTDASVAMVWSAWTCLDEFNSSIRFAYNPDTDRVYTISKNTLNFTDAQLFSGVQWPNGATVPVQLATIRNQAENDYVLSLAAGNDVWIGMTDEGSEGTWYWLSGDPMTFTNWNTGEPNSSGNAGQLYGDTGKWDDTGATNLKYAVYESTGTWADEDANGAPDDFEDKNNDLIPDGLGLPMPTAAFSADPISGDMPLTVQFTDASNGNGETITAWAWDFENDGIVDSTAQNPSHTFMAVDPSSTYTVSLTVTTVNGTDTETKANYITVNYTCGFAGQIVSQGAMFAEMLLADPSLSDDLKLLLTALGQTGWALFDWEGLEANFPPNPPTGAGDGLPDAAQMALIEEVACNTAIDANALTFAGLATNKALFLEDVAALAALEPDFAALALFGDYFAGMIGSSSAMKDTVNGLIFALTSGYTGLPSYAEYVVFNYGKAGDLYSAGGDLDGDGRTNLTEYNQVVAVGGGIDTFVIAATDPDNFWPGNPELPVAGILGLGLLAGSLLAGAALAIRKK